METDGGAEIRAGRQIESRGQTKTERQVNGQEATRIARRDERHPETVAVTCRTDGPDRQ